MNEQLISKEKTKLFFTKWQKFTLMVACWVIILCFVFGNDHYRVHALVKKQKKVFPNSHKTIDYQEVLSKRAKKSLSIQDLEVIKIPKVENYWKTKTTAAVFAGGDTCPTGTIINAVPYNDTGTTVGATDNYDLPPDTATPTVTGCPTCTGTGAGPAGSLPRGAVYTGTGTGPDVAYSITYAGAGPFNMTATMDPTATQDMAIIVYTNVCSSSLADGIVVDDTGAGGAAESVSITNMPAGTYNIVVDGYSTGGTPPGPSGPYTLNVTGSNPTPPVAADAFIKGRIVSAQGRGIANVTVAMTDQGGATREVKTNNFGYFTFDEVEVGQTYIINSFSKRYQFNPQVVTPTGNIVDLVITAQ